MPPKPKFTREEIIHAALEVVAETGTLTAAKLGKRLGSSARPIFTVFQNMGEVNDAVREAAMRRFEAFDEENLSAMPLFKQVGMRMVLFGRKEPKLYQLLFMEENREAVAFSDVFARLGKTAERCIALLREEHDLSEKQAKMLFENVWLYTFGLGAMCATRACRFSVDELGELLTMQFRATLLYIKHGGNIE